MPNHFLSLSLYLTCNTCVHNQSCLMLNAELLLQTQPVSQREQVCLGYKNSHHSKRSYHTHRLSCPVSVIFVHFNKNKIIWQMLGNSKIWNFVKICPMGVTLFHAHRQMDVQDQANSCISPKIYFMLSVFNIGQHYKVYIWIHLKRWKCHNYSACDVHFSIFHSSVSVC